MIRELTVQSLLDTLASPSATPGGGSSAAIMGAMGAALVSMVCNLTLGRQGDLKVEDQIRQGLERAQALRSKLTTLIQQDVDAYAGVIHAYSLPRATEAERALRGEAIQSALIEATLVPLACAQACGEVVDLARIVAEKGNLNAIGEAGAAALAAHAALRSAALNVHINTGSIRDQVFVDSKRAEIQQILHGRDGLDVNIRELITRRLERAQNRH